MPFIDLLDLLLKKAIYLSLKKKGLEKKNIVLPKQDYRTIFPQTKFRLFCSFRGIEDFIGWEWIDKLAKISRDEKLGIFECCAKVKNCNEKTFEGIKLVKNYFDMEFVKSEIGTGFDKLWICGPNAMHVQLYDIFTELGISHERICFV